MKRFKRMRRNPLVEKGSPLDTELMAYESLFQDEDDSPQETDHKMLDKYEEMMNFFQKSNPRGLKAIPTKKLKEILDEPFNRGVHGADFEAKYGVENIQSEYFQRLQKEDDKRLRKMEKQQRSIPYFLNSNDPIYGKVLWYRERDGNGIIIDSDKNEFYFDKSVLKLKPGQSIQSKTPVVFYHNKNITDCLCARDVSIYQGKAHQITLKWDFYESLSDIYAFLEIPDFPFYNVKIYPEQNQFTVVVGDGYKAKSERTFPRIDMAVEYAEKEFLKMANADKDYEVKVGR
jgi:hypothetical protein